MVWNLAWCNPRIVAVVFLAVLLPGQPVLVQGGVHLPFHKRTPTPALPEDHDSLRRIDSAGPHTPEQVRVVTWPSYMPSRGPRANVSVSGGLTRF